MHAAMAEKESWSAPELRGGRGTRRQAHMAAVRGAHRPEHRHMCVHMTMKSRPHATRENNLRGIVYYRLICYLYQGNKLTH